MSHPVTPEQLLLHDAGELDAAEARQVSSHTAGCAECAARVREWRTLGALVAKGGLPEPSAPRRERVLAAATARPLRRVAWGIAIVAAAALLLALGHAWWPSPKPLPPKPDDPWMARHREAMKRLDRTSIEFARAPEEGGVGAGVPVEEPEAETLARAREAVGVWGGMVHAETLFPTFVPSGVRFREVRLVDGVVEETFAGKGRSFTVFVGVQGAAKAAGLPCLVVGEGLTPEDLKRVEQSLESTVPK